MNKLELNIDNCVVLMPCENKGKPALMVIQPSELKKRKLLGLAEHDLMTIEELARDKSINKDRIILINEYKQDYFTREALRDCIKKVIKNNDCIIKNIQSSVYVDRASDVIEHLREGIRVNDIITTYLYRGIYSIRGLTNGAISEIIIFDNYNNLSTIIHKNNKNNDIIELNSRAEVGIGDINSAYEMSEVCVNETSKDIMGNPTEILRLCDELYKTCSGAFISDIKINMITVVHKKEDREKMKGILEKYGFGRVYTI